eukprot:SM000258S09120  [mRNA]  locus=s258:39100:40314:- [translate_table: standard]
MGLIFAYYRLCALPSTRRGALHLMERPSQAAPSATEAAARAAGAREWVEKLVEPSPPGKAGGRSFDAVVLPGLRVVVTAPGRCRCLLRVTRQLQNRYSTLHGGAIATLVDVVGSAALVSLTGSSSGVSTDINVSYISSAKAEAYKSDAMCCKKTEVEIDAKVLRVGRTLAVIQVDIRAVETGSMVAQGRHTKYLAPPPAKL